MMSGFVVCVDRTGVVDPCVHRTDCSVYVDRGSESVESVWFGPYASFLKAWMVCFHEAQSQRKLPQKHECISK